MRVLPALALLAMTFIATGCLAVSPLDHSLTPTPVIEDRSDCGQILGTAFRSDAEQAWFTGNCSAWAGTTVGRLPDPTPVGGAVNPDSGGQQQRGADGDRAGSGGRDGAQVNAQNTDNSERCSQLRGRPYENAADRQWYLANCQNQPQTVAADVRDCNQIRGRPYASEEQRIWFLANCLNQGQTPAGQPQADPQPGNAGASQGPSDAGPSQNANAGPTNAGQTAQPAVGPAGRPCSEIYGTRYRSGSEQAWFSENC
jgi:hypothetical protein